VGPGRPLYLFVYDGAGKCMAQGSTSTFVGTNRLAVRVSNAPEPDLAPLSGDFSVYGGLYRPVHLIVTGGEHFALTDHGSSGVAWLQTSVTDSRAVLDVTAQVGNATHRTTRLALVAKVLDARGQEVAQSRQDLAAAGNATAPYFLRVTVPQPHLWNGRQDPYPYQAVLELLAGETVVDSVAQPLGLRYYSVDPDQGFFLNGRPYPLHGVNKHQDRFNKGWAVSGADLEEDVALITELGAVSSDSEGMADYTITAGDVEVGMLIKHNGKESHFSLRS